MSRRKAYEAQLVERGRQRALTSINAALRRDDGAVTPAGTALVRRAIEPVAAAIRAFTDTALVGAGRAHAARPLLQGVSPDLAAYLAVKGTLNTTLKQGSVVAAATLVGRMLDDELRAARFETANGPLYRSIIDAATRRGTSQERLANSLRKAETAFEMDTQGWTAEQRQLVGLRLVDFVVEHSGFVAVEIAAPRRNRFTYTLRPADGIAAWFHAFNDAAALARPLYLPTPYKPLPWVTTVGGGYVFDGLPPKPLVIACRPAHRDVLRDADLRTVYRSLNALQDTAWAINTRVLDVLREADAHGLPLPDVPSRDNEPLPDMPPEIMALPTDHPDRASWRRMRRDAHMRNVQLAADRVEFSRRIRAAVDLAEHAAIYFPHRLDFRGRAYPFSEALSPQGNDMTKALLHFSESVRLGESGVRWLAIHGANVWGNDKVPLAERSLWAWNQHEAVLDVAKDPFTHRWWTEADKPWQFLAWCFEWADMLYSGKPEDFVSRLPVALDGSCNGLQHFSAMLRDEVAGRSVNLVPGDTPRDIYQDVADAVTEKLRAAVENGPDETRWLAEGWLAVGMDRKITKRAVMVLPYGGTFRSCLEYVSEAAREKLGGDNPFGDDLPKATGYLARAVWEAMGEVIVSARVVMGWVQTVARTLAKEGVGLRWTAPHGFPVVQEYTEVQSTRIQTRFHGALRKFRVNRATERLDSRKQALAAAPNFVHSHDAAALMLTVNKALAAGISAFAMIHDSYGTHAGNTETLARLLRAAFVEMYESYDPLADLYATALSVLPPDSAGKLPAPPDKGTLVLTEVLNSPYFFA